MAREKERGKIARGVFEEGRVLSTALRTEHPRISGEIIPAWHVLTFQSHLQ